MKRALALLMFVAAPAAARPNDPGSTDLYHYQAGETVESQDSAGGHFRIWFTRSGPDAVPAVDADANGIPDDVDYNLKLYEDVLTFYTGLGFRAPISDANESDNGGDGKFDVYLLDFAGKADGEFVREACDTNNVCTGYMAQENDFAGYGYPSITYANRVLASHEFFHAVQAAYDNSEDSIVVEGTAVWGTEQFDSSLNDFEGFVSGYLSRPDHSLYVPLPGPVSDFSYGSCIWWEFLSEKYGQSVIRELWEAIVGAPMWFPSLDPVLANHQSSFADAFFLFAQWNLYTGKRANPQLGYARGSGYTLVAMESDTAPLTIAAGSVRIFPAATNYFSLPPDGRTAMDAAVVVPAGVDGRVLRLALATLTGSTVSPVVIADATLRADIDTSSANQLFVLVSNVAESGSSAQPALCVGSPDEVDSCVMANMPADMGVTHSSSKGGCSISQTPMSGAPLWFLALALALTIRAFPRRKR
jgi:hypothetical protein